MGESGGMHKGFGVAESTREKREMVGEMRAGPFVRRGGRKVWVGRHFEMLGSSREGDNDERWRLKGWLL